MEGWNAVVVNYGMQDNILHGISLSYCETNIILFTQIYIYKMHLNY